MNLKLTSYLKQNSTWPQEGRHILAQYDERSIIVYQAYRPSIGNFALSHGYFGGQFSLNRMSWIKPNFLWMMYRSDWGKKQGQECVLGIRIKCSFFDSILEKAIPSIFYPGNYKDQKEWKNALANSSVRIQWDPDHGPQGDKVQRRAIQLGLRNEVLKEYSKEAIIEIIDMNDFIKIQRENVKSRKISKLITPKEEIYIPENPDLVRKLGLSIQ